MKDNHVLSYALGILFSFCLIVPLLITSVEAVTYWTPGYYEREYSKYNVTEDVHMEMDDLLDVTKEMMADLHHHGICLRGSSVASEGRYRPGSSTVCLLGNRTVFCHALCAGTCDIHRLHEIFRDLPPYFLQQ